MNNRGLHYFAVLTALATFALLGLGGLVTSNGAGMAVADWPTTYGYNMFFFRVSQWVGGIFYEHTHRLAASGVGYLTAILALWLYGKSARRVMFWAGLAMLLIGLATMPRRFDDGLVSSLTGAFFFGASFIWPRCEPSARWLRWCGVVAFIAVVLQGVLGGLRVVLHLDALGVFHALLAQLFFVLVCAIALFTSPWWQALPSSPVSAVNERFTSLFFAATLLIVAQLILGATMRHQHAGLAIPDFPLAYGKLWPAMDAGSVDAYNRHRMEIVSVEPITALQIALQMVHRIMALVILSAVAFCAWSARREFGKKNLLSRLSLRWLVLILAQALLGAFTIWSNKAADVATAHVLVGALSLVTGAFLCIMSRQNLMAAQKVAEVSPSASVMPSSPLVAHGAGGVK
jgi:cytochrome c oxidase assembly protein subunit 15